MSENTWKFLKSKKYLKLTEKLQLWLCNNYGGADKDLLQKFEFISMAKDGFRSRKKSPNIAKN